jgi:hypothetical protein
MAGHSALFPLHSLPDCGYKKRQSGRACVVSTNAALTKNHLPTKGDQWLSLRLPAYAQERKPLHISAFLNFQQQRARSLPKWNYQSHPITASLRSFFRTKLRSRSIWNRAYRSLLKLSVGNREVTNRSNDGDLFTAFNPNPSEMAGFYLGEFILGAVSGET